MSRYIDASYDQIKPLPIDFHRQIVPRTIEKRSTIRSIMSRLESFSSTLLQRREGRRVNDTAVLPKIVRIAYSRRMTGRCKINSLVSSP